MERALKTAVVGCGAISGIYLKNMTERFSILEVVACCSEHGESARQKAEQFGLKATTFEEILADPSIELVVNLTPAPAHYDIVKRSLLAGKHVYTEKVLTPSFESSKELVELAEEKGLYLGVAPDTFLGAPIQTAKAAIEQGMIGQVTSCHVNLNRDLSAFYRPGSFGILPGGGIGFDVGIYYLTALLSILGPVAQVGGIVRTEEPQRTVKNPLSPHYGETFTVENENMMMGVLNFKNGVLGTLHFTGCSILPEAPRVMIYGTQGILSIPDPNCFDGTVMVQKRGTQTLEPIPYGYGYSTNSRGLGVAEMAWSIRKGRPHRASGKMALHAVEVFEAITKSSSDGCFKKITTSFEIPKSLPAGYLDNYFRQNPEIALID